MRGNKQEVQRRINNAKEIASVDLKLRELILVRVPAEITRLTQLEVLDIGNNWITGVLPEIVQLANLQSLILENNKLTAIPSEISQLTKLREINLSGNQLTVVPPEISQLTNLKSLVLSDNKLVILPARIGQLENLQLLDLGGNMLTQIPSTIDQLKKLREINLSQNQLTVVHAAIGQLKDLQLLDLSGNKLTVVPPAIHHLKNLQEINISQNQLTVVPSMIGQLKNLQSLDLNGNMLTEVPPTIDQLKNLRKINFSGNKLKTVPFAISQLKDLQSLDLSGNKLTVVPPAIPYLKNLQEINLSNNQLKTVPDSLCELIQLRYLYLSDNELTTIPDWLVEMPQLQQLYIKGNPITQPPPEQLGDALTEWKPVDLESLRRYYAQLRREGQAFFYEAKLLVIGEGGAGKTSLVRKLQDSDAPLPLLEDSTDGIEIQTWGFPLPTATGDQQPVTGNQTYHVNIWDFGGQTVYHATHQFFLTKRSVYILVADTRRQHTDFYDWLKMQETFGGDSPIILLKNRNRKHGNQCVIENLIHLQKLFPNLKEVIELDLNNVPREAEWSVLLRYLEKHFLALNHIGQPRPKTWMKIRQELRQVTHQRSLARISYRQFLALCRKYGITDEKDALQLSDYLHHLGDILHFQNDPILADLVILKPAWGLDAVYRVLDNKEIAAANGHFTLTQLRDLWHEAHYHHHRDKLLRLMQKFQLCYPLRDVPDTFIAPQLLGAEIPTYKWVSADAYSFEGDLQLRYSYPIFMPRGILSRAIVALHHRIEEQRLVWRTGVILRDEYARAELLELRGEGEIRIRVSGRNKRDLLMEIVRALDDLHRSFPKLRYEKLVPCNCETCAASGSPHFFRLGKLLERLQHRRETIECDNPPYAKVQIRSLVDDAILQAELYSREEARIYVQGDYFAQGDKRMTGDTFNMSGDFRGANVNIKSRLTNVQQTIGKLPNADDAAKAELQQLVAQLNDALQQAPEDKAEEAEAVAQMAETLVETANSEKPNKMMLQITGEGLKKAAENIAAVMPTVLGIATQIVTAIMGLAG